MGLGADAVLRLHEDPVPGVLTAAHDEIGGHSVEPVGAPAQKDAPAGVGIGSEQLSEIVLFHSKAPYRSSFFRSAQSGRYRASSA